MLNSEEALLNLAILDLIQAIRDNDLAMAKKQTLYINEHYDKLNDEIIYLNEFIPFFELSTQFQEDEALLYVLNNLEHIYNVDLIKWNIQIKKLLINKNKQEIQQFIDNCLNSKIESYQYPQLIQLATIADYQQGLLKIRSLLQSDVKEQ